MIDCGVGEDRAIVDAIDTVAACETVEKGDTGPARAGRPEAHGARERQEAPAS